MKMMRLHRWLLDEYKRDGSFAWGKTIVGYSTLVLVIIIISGLVIWYPRNKKVLKNRLKIKTKAGWFRFPVRSTCLRRFYAALLCFVLALTGLTWSFGWYRDAFYTVFGISTTSKQTHAPASASPQKTSGDRGLKKHPKTNYTQWAEVLADLQTVIRNINRSPSRMDRQRFLLPPMEIQEEATAILLTRLPARSPKSNYTRTSLNPPK